jgi:hypothetical protein
MRQHSVLLASAIALVGCARGSSAPPAPAPLDPVGVYRFETAYQGQTVTGRVTVSGEPGSYSGSVEPDAVAPPMDIYSVVVQGQQMTLVCDAGGDDLVMTLTFSGDDFTGTWVLGMDGGEVKGARVRQ